MRFDYLSIDFQDILIALQPVLSPAPHGFMALTGKVQKTPYGTIYSLNEFFKKNIKRRGTRYPF
jgi:hypothetical protein